MAMTEIAVPGTDALAAGEGPSFRRILVPIRHASEAAETLAVAARVCCSTNGVLRLVHVRIFDPPMRGAGRFYPETRSEAAAIPDEALPIVWAYGLRATTAVVEAQRGEIALAIAQQALVWHADMIVMTRRPSPAICRLILGSVPDHVMRTSNCPVLAVHPGSRVTRNAIR
jgi:nucleotide-binding universal stress UspA family protein